VAASAGNAGIEQQTTVPDLVLSCESIAVPVRLSW
jgi:hypothetical protein